MSGKRYDENKVDMSLLPVEALWEVAKVMTYGAYKYLRDNWRSGMKWSRVIAPMQRHYAKFMMGEDIDPENGLLHLSELACNALFLLAFQILGIGEDDRPTITPEQLVRWKTMYENISPDQLALWMEQVAKIKAAQDEKETRRIEQEKSKELSGSERIKRKVTKKRGSNARPKKTKARKTNKERNRK